MRKTIIIIGLIFIMIILTTHLKPRIWNKNANVINKESFQKVAQNIDNLFQEWEVYNTDNYSIRYPSSWLKEDKGTFFVYDPKEAYQTHSRPPIIYNRFVIIEKVEFTTKSAKQYIGEKSSEKANEINQYYPEDKNSANYNQVSKKEGHLEFAAYNSYPISAGNYQENKEFAISNGKVLLIGVAVFDNFDDGSTESQILKTIVFK